MSKKKKSAPDTTKKGGKAPPDVTLDYVLKNLLDYFKGFKGLQDTENEINKKYNIDKSTTVWNADDVKKAWGKTQRMNKYSTRRKTWSLAIILQAISDITLNKTNCSFEKTADINVGPNAGTASQHFTCEYTPNTNEEPNAGAERSLQKIYELTQDIPKKRSCPELLKDDDSTMDGPTKRSRVATKPESNAATESQNFTCENTPNTNEDPNAGTESQGASKIAIDDKEMSGNRTSDRLKKPGSYADSHTVYIRIPLSFLDVSQEIICQKTEKKGYKLIDGVPSLKTMKKTSYVVQYDNQTNNWAWVFEILNKQTLSEQEDLLKTISSDTPIRDNKTSKNPIYLEGYLADAANHKWSQKAMDDTFHLSNIVPQIADLKKNDWGSLENMCREYTKEHNNVYVYTGPLYLPQEENGQVTYKFWEKKAVPTHFFKVIILENNDGTMDVKCYQMANADLQTYIPCQLDEIESLSGMVFSEKSPFVSTNEEPESQGRSELKKIAIDDKEMSGNRTSDRLKKPGSYADSQTVYIRIPLSFLDVSQEIICQKTEKKGYKLIDGVPSFTQTMKKTSYVVQYDNRTNNAAWVFEILNKQTLSKREDLLKTTRSDINIPHLIVTSDQKIKYHKGHLAAAANYKWSQKAMDDTFHLSNMVPQNGDLNTNDWKTLEKDCRGYAKKHRNVYVYTGPLYLPPENSSKITYKFCLIKAVPTHLFKVIILENNDGILEVECYIAANADLQKRIRCQLDDIERWSGMVFSEKSQFVRNEESEVKVKWSAQETGETHSINTTFKITRSQDSKEQIFWGLGRAPVMKKYHSV